MIENIRFTVVDGEYFVSVPDLAALYMATHDELKAEGQESPYADIATALSIPFMELDGVQPGAVVEFKPEGLPGADG